MIKRGKSISPENVEKVFLLGEKVSTIPEVVLLYLFGSCAVEKMTALSDIDLAVLLEGNPSTEKSFDLLCRLTDLISETIETDEFDLIDINAAPLTMKYQIIRTGKILYARSNKERADFEERTRALFFDFEPRLREYYQQLFRKIKAGDPSWLTR